MDDNWKSASAIWSASRFRGNKNVPRKRHTRYLTVYRSFNPEASLEIQGGWANAFLSKNLVALSPLCRYARGLRGHEPLTLSVQRSSCLAFIPHFILFIVFIARGLFDDLHQASWQVANEDVRFHFSSHFCFGLPCSAFARGAILPH